MRTTISLTFKHTFIYTVTYTCKIDSIHPSLPRSIPLPAPLLAPSHLSFHAGLYIHGPYCFISRLQSIRENLPRAIFFYPVSALRNALRLGTFTARINTMTIITTDLYSSEFVLLYVHLTLVIWKFFRFASCDNSVIIGLLCYTSGPCSTFVPWPL